MSDTNKPLHIMSQAEFQKEVLDAKEPVMVDFYADWCGPCKLAEPIMNDLNVEYVGKAKIVKVDVDLPENRAIAQNYGIMSIPTVMMIKGGEIHQRATGFIGEDGYREMLEKSL